MYMFVGILLGSMVTSTHADLESCAGRRYVLAEKGVMGDCVPIQYSIVAKGQGVYIPKGSR